MCSEFQGKESLKQKVKLRMGVELTPEWINLYDPNSWSHQLVTIDTVSLFNIKCTELRQEDLRSPTFLGDCACIGFYGGAGFVWTPREVPPLPQGGILLRENGLVHRPLPPSIHLCVALRGGGSGVGRAKTARTLDVYTRKLSSSLIVNQFIINILSFHVCYINLQQRAKTLYWPGYGGHVGVTERVAEGELGLSPLTGSLEAALICLLHYRQADRLPHSRGHVR